MSDKSLGQLNQQMTSVEFVERAASWSRDLTRMRARGPGDLENAMRAIERDYGIDYQTQLRLRYRTARLRSIAAHVYARIAAAYQHECERQRARLAHQIDRTKEIAGADCPAVRAAEALLRDDEGEMEP